MSTFQPVLEKLFERNQRAEIIYLSASGSLTHRVIKIKKVTPFWVKGYCYLRKTERTFSLQNILSIYPVQNNQESPFKHAAGR
ncbi:hypothetical protein [Bacillus pinisoli]|uniref:hypothetical protein n=1 Tax=Bacillus pinisoli TaxID=2901866 RepID=UPI001FF3CFDB|nr:hypothetical protein [Bacillus pinisoli]